MLALKLFAVACMITAWVWTVIEMRNDPDWGYGPEEYRDE